MRTLQVGRISLFFIIAVSLSNIFRFELFGVEKLYADVPLWVFVFTGPLQSFGVLVGALLAYTLLRKERETKHSLFGKSLPLSVLMALILVLAMAFVGLQNDKGIQKNFLGFLSGISFLLYCIFEEYGWRGYLFDELRLEKPIFRILLTALLWYVWHLSFIYDHDVLSNLKFFGILLIGSWGIEQVIKSTHSIISAACFHSIYNILMMQSGGQISISLNQKLLVLGVCLATWILLLNLWEKGILRKVKNKILKNTAILSALLFLSISALYQCKDDKISTAEKISTRLIPKIQSENNPTYFHLEERMSYYSVPGFSLATIKNGRLESNKAFGYSRREEDIRTSSETVYQAGSISKSVTALVVIKLYNDKKLDIDQDITAYLKSWQLPKSKFTRYTKPTLRMLLNHTSGLHPQERVKLEDVGFDQYASIPSLNAILNGETPLQAVGFDTIPGVVHEYSNQGYNVIQKVLEDIFDVPIAELVAKVVLEPFNMSTSTFDLIYHSQADSRYAHSYRDGKVTEGYWKHEAGICSGGLYTTPTDLCKFISKVANIINGKDSFLSPSVAQQIIDGDNYGLGFDLHKTNELNLISHSGRNPGFFAYTVININTGNGFSMMTNSDNASGLFSETLRAASDVFNWSYALPRFITTIDPGQEIRQTLLGDYRYFEDGDEEILTIGEENDQLFYFVKGEIDATRYPLGAINENTFVDLVDGNKLEFVFDTITRKLRIEYDEEYTYYRIE